MPTQFSRLLHARAKSLRTQSTIAEQHLWHCLRARRTMGWKFRRQQPMGPYIVDFVCHELRLVIELDGSQHVDAAGPDAERDAILLKRGYLVLRFWNHDVLTEIDSVMARIWEVGVRRAPSGRP